MSQNTVEATIEDGEKILEMIESSPAKGKIELLYTRRPNAYVSYKKESNNVRVLKVVEDEKIIGTMTKVNRDVYINGEIKRVSYLCGLKKEDGYNVNWGKIWLRNLIDESVDSYYCSVLADNEYAKSMAEKKRKRSLNMNCICDYTTYIMASSIKVKIKENKYIFRQATEKDEENVIEFLNNEGKNKDFFPTFQRINQFTNLNIIDFYILEDNNRILSVGALWEQTDYRQYIVKNYKGIMKYAKVINPFLRLLGYIELPKKNEVLKFPMLSFFISKDDNEEYYKIFLNNIVKIIEQKYKMFIVGTSKNYFANDIYKNLKNIHFDSKIYEIDLLYGNGRKQEINKNTAWLECGLL